MNTTDTGPTYHELDFVIAEVKKEFKVLIGKKKDLIIKLGEAFERVVAIQESICEEIKNALKDEIAEGDISARNIERYCPDKWKHKRKPKNDKLSFVNHFDQVSPIELDNKGRVISESSTKSDNGRTMADSKNLIHSSLDGETKEAEFECSFEYMKLQRYMADEFKNHQGTEMIWIHGTIDMETHKVTSVEMGRKNVRTF